MVEVSAAEDEGEDWVTISVRDTGPGISAEEQERVFDRFFRGKLAESGHVPGTGLGLTAGGAGDPAGTRRPDHGGKPVG